MDLKRGLVYEFYSILSQKATLRERLNKKKFDFKLIITFDYIKDIGDVSDMLKRRITHFFEHYKELEKGKWVKVVGWENAKKANQIIDEALERADL